MRKVSFFTVICARRVTGCFQSIHIPKGAEGIVGAQ